MSIVTEVERSVSDFAYAGRILRKNPAFAFVAVLSLALGIGANTAIFSLVDGLWTRPMAVPNPGRIARVFSVTGQDSEGAFSFPEYLALQKQASDFQGLVALGGRGARLPNGDGTFDLLLVDVVSTNFFTTLGVQPVAGRLFGPGDESSLNQEPVVVLGNSFWRRRFGADPNVVGRQLRLNRDGQPVAFTIIGVLPSSFREIDPASDRDLWLPPQSWVRLAGRDDFEARGFRWFQVLGRLAPSSSAASATVQVETVARRMAADWPATNAGRSARVMSDFRYRLELAGTNALALMIIVLLVVLLCSVNVANLLLARSSARSREIAIRLAIGAGRGRLVRQLMTENLFLGLAGLAFGLGIGAALIRLLPRLMVLPPGFNVQLDFFQLDRRVFVFSLVVSLVTVTLFGLAPALKSSRVSLVPALKEGSGFNDGRRRHRLGFRHWLVVAQIAISLTLLVATGLLVASFSNTRTSDIGISRKPLLLAWLPYDSDRRTTYQEAIDQIKALPGVKDVAVALRAPLSLSGGGYAQKVTFPGRTDLLGQPPIEIKFNAISANYLRVMGTALRKGRDFNQLDEANGPPVALIDERMAQVYWPGQDPIDKLIHLEGQKAGDYRVAGVVQSAPITAIGERPVPYIYLPFWRAPVPEMTLIVETSVEASILASAVRHTLVKLDSRLDPLSITTEEDLIRYSAGQYQITAELVTALGILGLILTAVGLYGVMSYGVSQRTREIGIRMALGANRSETLASVLKEAAVMGLIGVGIGLPLAMITSRLAAALLFGVSPWNAAIMAAAVGVSAVTLFLAGIIPARRATRIDPMVALRYE